MSPQPPQRRYRPAPTLIAWIALALSISAPSAALAQSSAGDDGVRIGVSFGGISTLGLIFEVFDGNRSLDLSVGTWTFRDVSAALVVKQYFGAGSLRPFVGGGLWMVVAAPPDERLGFAAVLHAPIGADWRAHGDHYLGLAMNVNRALMVRRTDPEDDLPVNHGLVPLPGIYYRMGR